jgi:hypothetical protein
MRMCGGEAPRGFIPRYRCLAIPAVLAPSRSRARPHGQGPAAGTRRTKAW